MLLYIIISNSGDGSFSTNYTLDPDVITELESQESDGTLDFERWSDGDGFHYDTINVPDGSTAESLGVGLIDLEDVQQEDY